MADWVTISSLATAGGNMLVLAVGTFSSVRWANRRRGWPSRACSPGCAPCWSPPTNDRRRWRSSSSETARCCTSAATAARSSSGRRRPSTWPWGCATGAPGLAVIHGWGVEPRAWLHRAATNTQADETRCRRVEHFRRQQIDVYFPWRRTRATGSEPCRDATRADLGGSCAQAAHARGGLELDLLYGDHEGRPADDHTLRARALVCGRRGGPRRQASHRAGLLEHRPRRPALAPWSVSCSGAPPRPALSSAVILVRPARWRDPDRAGRRRHRSRRRAWPPSPCGRRDLLRQLRVLVLQLLGSALELVGQPLVILALHARNLSGRAACQTARIRAARGAQATKPPSGSTGSPPRPSRADRRPCCGRRSPPPRTPGWPSRSEPRCGSRRRPAARGDRLRLLGEPASSISRVRRCGRRRARRVADVDQLDLAAGEQLGDLWGV